MEKGLNSQEKVPGITKIVAELRPRLDREFQQFIDINIAGTRREYAEMVLEGLISETPDDIEIKINSKIKEFSEMDPDDRIATLVNNFRFWWPSGFYRDIFEKKKIKSELDTSEIEATERLIKDLDGIIERKGYDSVAVDVAQTKNLDRPTRLGVLADVFCNMRDLGYSGSQLRQ